MEKNQILFDKSALLSILKALGFTVNHGVLYRNGNIVLDPKNRSIPIFSIKGFHDGHIFVKREEKIEKIPW